VNAGISAAALGHGRGGVAFPVNDPQLEIAVALDQLDVSDGLG
jgi:hypothetical protein